MVVPSINNFVLGNAIIAWLLMSCTSETKEFYENGKVKKVCVQKKAPSYSCTFYFENGNVKELQEFVDAKKNVTIKSYHENGQLEKEAKLRNDTIYFSKLFDKNGLLINECSENKYYKFYQYYKNKNLFCINYLRKVTGKEEYLEDSIVIFSKLINKKIIKFEKIHKSDNQLASFFSEDGRKTHEEIVSSFAQHDGIINAVLQNDTTDLYYKPVL